MTRRSPLASVAMAAILLSVYATVLPSSPAAAGKVGPDDFQISNQAAQAGVGGSSVAYDPVHDRFLVTWEGTVDTYNGSRSQIFGRLVDARTGAVRGRVVVLSRLLPRRDATVDAISPSVAYDRTAREFVVVFAGDDTSEATGGTVLDTFEIYAQRVAVDATPVGPLVQVSDMGRRAGDSRYDAANPDLTYNQVLDQYLVVWEGDDTVLADNELEIYGQLLGHSGDALVELGDNDVRYSDMGSDGSETTDARRPSVAWDREDRTYLVAWDGNEVGAAGTEVYRIYGQTVDTRGSELAANDIRIGGFGGSDNTLEQSRADVAWDSATDQFVVVWEGDGANGGEGAANDVEIFGRRISGATGAPVGAPRQLTTMGTDGAGYVAHDPALAYNSAHDDFLLTWTGDDTVGRLADDHFETFSATLSGRLVPSDRSRVSTRGALDQPNASPTPSAVAFAERGVGDYLVAWGGEDPDSLSLGESEVFGHLVAPLGAPELALSGGRCSGGGTASTLLVAAADPDGDSVTVTATSTNPRLLPPRGIRVSGTGRSRAVQLTPVDGERGRGVVTITATDGWESAQVRVSLFVGGPDGSQARATNAADVVMAMGGNDTVRAGGGSDVVCAGPGRDTVRAGAGADSVYGGGGADELVGSRGADDLRGGGGADVIRALAGADTVRGGLGRDTLIGGVGPDRFQGGPGVDTYRDFSRPEGDTRF